MNRVLVISDLHLSHRVQKRKLEFLKKLVSEYDQVILLMEIFGTTGLLHLINL